MGRSVQFEVVAGSAILCEGGQDVPYKEGDVVTSDKPLDQLFRNKFVRLDRSPAKLARLSGGDDPEVGPHDGPEVISRPQPEERPMRKPRRDMHSDDGYSDEADGRVAEQKAEERPRKKAASKVSEENEATTPRKSSPSKGGKKPETEDMTDDFPLAKENDLKVTYVAGEGYTVKDGRKTVNSKPLGNAKDVEALLKEYASDEDEKDED